jgi:hypothetical protein
MGVDALRASTAGAFLVRFRLGSSVSYSAAA